MDTKIVEISKNINISRALNNESKFTYNINNIPFIPNAMKVKQIVYIPTAPDPDAFVVYTDMVSDIIGTAFQNVVTSLDNFFLLNNSIRGNYTFSFKTVEDGLGVSVANPITGSIFIQIEFIKYKEVKEGKIY